MDFAEMIPSAVGAGDTTGTYGFNQFLDQTFEYRTTDGRQYCSPNAEMLPPNTYNFVRLDHSSHLVLLYR
jgi:hypothetical protein